MPAILWRSWMRSYVYPVVILFAVSFGGMLIAQLLTGDVEGWDLLINLVLVPITAFIVGMIFLPPKGWIITLVYLIPIVILALVNNPDAFLNVFLLIGGPIWLLIFLGKEARLIWRESHRRPAV